MSTKMLALIAAGVLGFATLGYVVNEYFLPETATHVDEDLPGGAAQASDGANHPAGGASQSGDAGATTTQAKRLLHGTFEDDDSIHSVSGTIQVLEIDGARYLRFEDYEQTQGPDVYVYLTPFDRPREIDDVEGEGIRILIEGGADGGESTKEGNFNQRLPDDIDLSGIKSVSIWCAQFDEQFGFAKLSAP